MGDRGAVRELQQGVSAGWTLGLGERVDTRNQIWVVLLADLVITSIVVLLSWCLSGLEPRG